MNASNKNRFLAVAATLLITGAAMSQEADFKELPAVVITEKTVNVNEKISKSFAKQFKDAENARWFIVNKNFLVKFITGDQSNNALFTKNGTMIYHISYGVEKHLPADLRRTVKSNYVDFEIPRVIKVTEANREIYVVNVEDKSNLILVRIEDGAMEEVGRYTKSM